MLVYLKNRNCGKVGVKCEKLRESSGFSTCLFQQKWVNLRKSYIKQGFCVKRTDLQIVDNLVDMSTTFLGPKFFTY